MKKTTNLKTVLIVLFIVAMLISNIITAKQISIPFIGTMTAGILVFPITYILSDVFSECYGYICSRETCYIAFVMNIFMVCVFGIAISLPASPHWEGQVAFETVLGNSPRILSASLFAYIVGDLVNDKIFQKMKNKQNGFKGFSFRAIVSSIFGNLTDSVIFMPLAFWGEVPLDVLVTMCITQASLKTLYEIIMLPLTNLTVRLVNKYENKEAQYV